MPRGRRTSYTRDNNGRFASSPGGGAPKRSTPATRRAAMRAGNRLNRDNSGRISGIGRNGATVRGGRLKTAKGNRRATQLASMKAAGFRGGTIAKGGRGVRGSVARSLAAVRQARMAGASSRIGGAGNVLQRRDNAEAQRVAANGGRRTSRKAAIRRREYNSITTAVRARYAIDNPGKQRRYSTVKNPGPAGVSALTTKAPRLTAKASQPSPQTRAKRPGSTVRKPSGLRPGALAARRASKPAAAKPQPQRPSKKPANKAQRAYLAARSNARSRGGDLRGADAGSRRMASSAAAVVRNMERRRSAAVPKAPADSPRAKQQQRQATRAQRAVRNQRAAMARVLDGPGSKASRSASVARRAQQIYAGKVDPKAKTKSRLTKTRDPEVLRKRIAKIKDNTARAAAKAAAKAAKASAKPAKPARARRSTVVPALQGSDKLAPLSPQRKKVLGRANARATALADMANKAKDELKRAQNKAIPANNRYSDMTPQARKTALTRLAKAEKANNKINKSSQTAQRARSFAEGMAGATKQGYTRYDNAVRRSDIRTPKPKAATKPTAPKRTRASRPAGTVAKPRGMKPGVLAARRGAKAKPAALTGKGRAPSSRLTKPVKQEDGSFDVNGRPAKTMQDAMRVLRQQRAQEKERALSAKRISAIKRVDRADLQAVEKGKGKRANSPYARENAISRFSQKETQASNRADKVANQGRALEAEYTKLTRKPATKANEKRIQQLRSQITKLRRSFDTLLRASKSYNQRGLAVRRPFPRIYR